MPFCLRRIVSTYCSVNSGFCLHMLPSTWQSGHMKFCPPRIVSTFASVNSGFCLRVVVSTWESVQLDVCLLAFGPLGSQAIWHSTNVGFCPSWILSTLDSAHVLFYLIGIMSTLKFVYLEAMCLQVWPHDILPT